MHRGPASSLLLALVLLLLATGVPWAGLAIPAAPTRRVNDYARVLSPAERDGLEQKLAGREATSSNQVVAAIFRSLEGENLEDYSIRLAQAWRIGQKGLDNGVIFLIFLDDRKMRIEVGYGLEAKLTDAVASSIIRDVVAPRFRERRYAEGIDAGLDAIGRAITGTYQQPVRSAAGRAVALGPWLVFGVFALFIGFVLVGAIVNAQRSRQRGWTGGRRGWTATAPTLFSGSGSSWSSSSSSSSSDGFSGGGGSFGGGGSSGEW